MRASASLVLETLPEPTEDQAKALKFITGEVDRLDHFVRTLLDFSAPVCADVRPVVLAELLAEVSERSGVEVELDVRGVGASVDTDAGLLSAALLGLVRNAAEEVGETGRVAIRSRCEGRDLLLDVTDDGSGVSAGSEASVFEPFFTTKARGTGLGLPMVGRAADALGGSLELVPGGGLGDGGRGACFRLRLPGAARGEGR